jgi:cytochrome oxidase Cu insertion factor (SCO1/SenC/PrrC family)
MYNCRTVNALNRISGGFMKRVFAAALLLAALPASTLLSTITQNEKVAKISLKVGETAPDFTLLSDQWKPVKLSDFKGKKNVLLAVYVLAFTGG